MDLQIPPMAEEVTPTSINLRNKGLPEKIWRKELKNKRA
jgi:hypothetical protein